jgi:hypothetical protein
MLALGMLLSCGDSGGPGNPPASVTGITGDNQSAPTGSALEFPLSFTVLGTNGSPLPGATVAWTATPTSGAFFSPTTSTTNANGIAETFVTMGNAVGDIVIRGTVSGLQPVTFHAQAVDPCSFLRAYTFGSSVSGSLSTTDCNLQGYYVDFYALDLPATPQGIRINQTSTMIDSWLELYRINDQFVGLHDDIDPGVVKNARLDVVLGAGGSFFILATSWDAGETGSYTMSAVPWTPAFTN